MIAALALAASLATPAPTPFPTQTPPPEPNHATIAGSESYIRASGDNWQRWNGFISQISGLYEFQASPALRFSNFVHWQRLSSHYDASFLGKTFSAPFNYDEYDDEFDVELGKPQLPTGVGIGYYDYSPVYGFRTYHLAGFGIGVDHWSNWYVRNSFYYSVWYYPNVASAPSSNMAYAIARADIGLNVRQSLVSPWGLRIGVQGERWFGKTPQSPTFNFLGPYVSLTWWQ
ncbi:MAG TPA: hypothetical protein VMV82_10025 [Candidatus Dormibacteraeota bacterium]|nr:hypothetical protein [Candidatus Dormibacteraeota bacterium]